MCAIHSSLQVSGHRIGTAELESAFARHEGVVEAAVVAAPHVLKGECIYAFVICREGFHFNEKLVVRPISVSWQISVQILFRMS